MLCATLYFAQIYFKLLLQIHLYPHIRHSRKYLSLHIVADTYMNGVTLRERELPYGEGVLVSADAVAQEIAAAVCNLAFHGIRIHLAMGKHRLLEDKTDTGKWEIACHPQSQQLLVRAAARKARHVEEQGVVFFPPRYRCMVERVIHGIRGA